MGEIEDEAYTEVCEENGRLEVEVKRLKETTTLLQRECAKRGMRVADLERLIIRAADALEEARKFDFLSPEVLDANGITEDLIAELRKAAG